MPKPWYSIKAAAEGSDFAEVSILEDIHPWYGCNAKSFLTEFRAIKASKVKLYINSPGGSVIEALAIFNGMRATGKQIEVHVLGIAASAASYIAMAAHKIVMPANTFMFLHNPESGAHGNADELREVADTLDKMAVSLTATYAKRWKGEEKALAPFLADEPLLTAAECLEHGFCDEVTDEIEATASFDVETLPPAARAAFNAAAAKKTDPAPAPAAPVAAETPLATQIKAMAEKAGLTDFVAVLVTDPEASTVEQARGVIARASQVKALGEHVGLPDLAASMIRERKTVDEARALLSKAMEVASDALAIDTATKSKHLQGRPAASWSPTSLWAEIHAMKAGS